VDVSNGPAAIVGFAIADYFARCVFDEVQKVAGFKFLFGANISVC
jgi:hypothetical protein